MKKHSKSILIISLILIVATIAIYNRTMDIIDPPIPLGFDDSIALQKLLDKGGVIDLGDKTYNIYHQLELRSDTTITSSGAKLVKLFNKDGSEYLFTSKRPTLKNVTISNITVDLKGHRNVLDDNTRFFSYYKNLSNVTIDNVTVENTTGYVVEVRPRTDSPNGKSKGLTVSNCTINTIDEPEGPMIWLLESENFVIENNYISSGKGQVWLAYSKNGLINNNQFLNVDNYWSPDAHLGGVELYTACENITISNNKITSAQDSDDSYIVGLRVKNSNYIVIEGNEIQWDNERSEAINIRKDEVYDINPTGFIVRDNTITGRTPEGIQVVTIVSDATITNVEVSNNTMLDKSIVFHPTTNAENIFYNDVVVDGNDCAQIKFHGLQSENVTITNNNVYAFNEDMTSGTTIYARNLLGPTILNNTIYGNNLIDVITGIDISYSGNAQVSGNEFRDVDVRIKRYKSY
ncbi:hypothetical protein EZV73_19195 [Acidaminobacter sp. JC074]|uniref:right-handed parallel beta-helix repeat-containing protein n=1 Tax=Acidaminobacter sp. JC074 TaxID=2530199 RepID=UPI001F0DC6B6|nr:right-handed parallel beta-helix repeat-containing protein [Acidaminobacter sp. JC074]MCH4889717.1 hypothetical protein [Acidaminobacter sp. JC074]